MLVALIVFSLNGSIPSGLFPGLSAGYPEAGMLFMAALILLAILAISGVFMMWQLKKVGFYLYSLAKMLIYFLPVVVIGSNHLTYPGLVLTSTLIVLYGILFSGKVRY
jgi:cytochrome b subunit of formate dehydrogenase